MERGGQEQLLTVSFWSFASRLHPQSSSRMTSVESCANVTGRKDPLREVPPDLGGRPSMGRTHAGTVAGFVGRLRKDFGFVIFATNR